MDGQIPKEIKTKRLQALLDIQNNMAREQNQRYIGKTVRVLVEGYAGNKQEYMTGRTGNNIIVNFPADGSAMNQYVDIRVDRVQNWAMFGDMIKIDQ